MLNYTTNKEVKEETAGFALLKIISRPLIRHYTNYNLAVYQTLVCNFAFLGEVCHREFRYFFNPRTYNNNNNNNNNNKARLNTSIALTSTGCSWCFTTN